MDLADLRENLPKLRESAKNQIRNKLQKQTADEAKELLALYGKVLIMRPTGFGKTHLLMIRIVINYILANQGLKNPKRVLFVYPLNVIGDDVKSKYTPLSREDLRIELNKLDSENDKKALKKKNKIAELIMANVDFLTFSKINDIYKELGDSRIREEWGKTYSLIILDEAHRAGSEGFCSIYKAIESLISPNGLHLIGATATPRRTKAEEERVVIDGIFDGHMVSEFEIERAIALGIMQPYVHRTHVYISKETIAKKRKEYAEKWYNKDKEFDFEGFDKAAKKCLNDKGASDLIRSTLEDVGKSPRNPDLEKTYYKFIVFFKDTNDMKNRGPRVQDWFEKAFNEEGKRQLKVKYQFRIAYLTTSDKDEEITAMVEASKSLERTELYYFNKVDKLNDTLVKGVRRVDLIFAIDMVNMGYHVPNMTGVVLMRDTTSEIIYKQQRGRCLSIMCKEPTIIFDFVDNDGTFRESDKGKRDEEEKQLRRLEAKDAEEIEILERMRLVEEFIYTDNNNNITNRTDIDDLHKVYGDVDSAIKERIIWAYTVKNMPIVSIVSDITVHEVENKRRANSKWTVKKVCDLLNEQGVILRKEDKMFKYLLQENEKYNPIMHCLHSDDANQYSKTNLGHTRTIFDVVEELKASGK